MSDSKKQGFGKGVPLEGIPNIRYDVYFKIFGLISTGMDIQTRNGTVKQGKGSRGQRIYCQMICTMLWFFALRSFVLMFISDRELQVMMGDVTGYWNDYRLYYLMPMLFFSLQTAITSSIFLSKEKDLAWLVPFLSVKQLESGTMRTSQFRASAHKIRIYLGIGFDLCVVAVTTAAVSWVYINTCLSNMDDATLRMWLPWLAIHILWFFYMSGITFFVMTYFNLICIMLARRFAVVCKDIEALAEQENGPPGSKNNALTTLYFEHNEVCELVDEANVFWQSYVFFSYMTYIPCSCYALYNLFFADFDDLLQTVTWTSFFQTIFLIGYISVSAAGVSAEAHAPYTALHTLSLLQLPIDLEVNMSTFLHRVRGPTIGFSCLDLFVVTNASISNTIAAVASYFLIVADFSRSTVAASAAAKVAEEAEKALANSTGTTTMMSIGAELTS